MTLDQATQTAPTVSGPRRKVSLIDAEQVWLRHPSDLVGSVVTLLIMAIIGVLAVYAQSTTVAVTSDVRTVTSPVLETILIVPINILEGLLSFFLPIIILVEMIFHRRWRAILTALIAGSLAVLLANLSRWAGEKWWPTSPLVDQISDALQEQELVALIPYVSLISAFLVVAGGGKATRIVQTGWWLTGIVLVLTVLQGDQTLPGALLTVFLGTMSAYLVRWIIGAAPRRATGQELVRLIRRTGLDPVQVVRVDDDATAVSGATITTTAPIGYSDHSSFAALIRMWESAPGEPHNRKRSEPIRTDHLDEPGPDDAAEEPQTLIEKVDQLSDVDGIVVDPLIEASHIRAEMREKFPTSQPETVSRNYLVTDTTGTVYHVEVLDDDRRIVGVLENMWNRFRLKAGVRHAEQTIEGAAEQMALMQLRAEHAGLLQERFVSMARSEVSIVVAQRANTRKLLPDVDPDSVSDEQIDALWAELQKAHFYGISHGNIQATNVKVASHGLVLNSWQDGSTLASEIGRRIDLAQTTSMLAAIFGVERAVASMSRCIPLDHIVALIPILQPAIMPGRTRAAFRGNKEFQKLRDALVAKLPEDTTIEPLEVKRFSTKTVVSVMIGVAAVYILLGSMNFEEVSQAIRHANVTWMIVAFLFGLLTYVGAGVTLKAYTPERLPLGETILVQVAASVVSLVAPAGIGPAALNLRFLQKKGVGTAPAVATATVVQLAQFVTTIVLLLIFGLISGDLGKLSLPSGSILIGIGLVLVVIAVLLAIRGLREWILNKIRPALQQVKPRLVWLMTNPTRILHGFGGSIIMTVGFIACFGFSLKAFGYELPVLTLAVTYLISNSVGSIVPSPGGVGPVEAALTGGLVIAAVPYSVAFSTAILYRLLTFWGRVPLGWIALQIAGKKGII